jgi:TBC1 domain family member 5
MLEEAISDLKDISSSESKLEDKADIRDALEVAVSKLQLVKGLLEDSAAALPDGGDVKISVTPPLHPPAASGASTERKVDSEPLSDAVATMASNTPMVSDSDTLVMNDDDNDIPKGTTTTATVVPSSSSTPPTNDPSGPGADEGDAEKKKDDTDPLGAVETSTAVQTLKRPQPPIPTRSTLAQSSFSWMLEPDTSISAASSAPTSASKSVFGSAPAIRSDGGAHRKRPSANANRERTAFLFGEVPADAEGNAIREEDIFGLEPIGKGKR